MVAAMRDSRLRSADFIHSLLGFTAGRAAATAAILDPPRGLPQRFSSGERADVSLYVSIKATGKKHGRVKYAT